MSPQSAPHSRRRPNSQAPDICLRNCYRPMRKRMYGPSLAAQQLPMSYHVLDIRMTVSEQVFRLSGLPVLVRSAPLHVTADQRGRNNAQL